MHSAISIKDLTFTYPDGRQALKGVTMEVQSGEKIALVGPNGAGKSTLILHLNGLFEGEGTIQVAGFDLSDCDMGRLRAAVGIVFQNPDDQLFSSTVFDDVAFGPLHMGYPESQIRHLVDTSLQAVGMAEFVDRVPFHLSAGEKKRIAIATVLSMGPEILVLDEPTSGLDPQARRNLIRLLNDLEMTMLVATHDLALVSELLPRTAVMDCGKIVAVGPTPEILSDRQLLEQHGLELPYRN